MRIDLHSHSNASDGAEPPSEVVRRTGEVAAVGLFGLEVDHAGHEPADREHLRRLAADLDLETTGPSDDNRRLTSHRLGRETTAPAVYERLVAVGSGAAPITVGGE